MARITALKYCMKADLQNLARVLAVEIDENDTIEIIIEKIENADSYDADFALAQAGYIVQVREEVAKREP